MAQFRLNRETPNTGLIPGYSHTGVCPIETESSETRKSLSHTQPKSRLQILGTFSCKCILKQTEKRAIEKGHEKKSRRDSNSQEIIFKCENLLVKKKNACLKQRKVICITFQLGTTI